MTEVWHVICSTNLLDMLRRCHAGDDPEMVYLEAYVNADRAGDNDDDE